MKRKSRVWAITVVASGVVALTGCGAVAKMSDEQADRKSASNGVNLTEDAEEAVDAAEDEAAASDAATDDTADVDTVETQSDTMAVIEAVRAYTRELLGISDEPLKEFKATIEAAKVMATSKEEFKAMADEAHEALTAALDAQKEAADAARVEHKDELKALFTATKQVFKECGNAVELKEPGARGDRGPIAVFGSGEFKGKFVELKKKAGPEARRLEQHRKTKGLAGRSEKGARQADERMGPGFGGGERFDEMGPRAIGGRDWLGLSDTSAADDDTSVACDDATAALQALLPTAD